MTFSAAFSDVGSDNLIRLPIRGSLAQTGDLRKDHHSGGDQGLFWQAIIGSVCTIGVVYAEAACGW
jgi:hypothetical protein